MPLWPVLAQYERQVDFAAARTGPGSGAVPETVRQRDATGRPDTDKRLPERGMQIDGARIAERWWVA